MWRIFQHFLNLGTEARGSEMDLKPLQLDAAGGNGEQTHDGRTARIIATRVPEGEGLQSG